MSQHFFFFGVGEKSKGHMVCTSGMNLEIINLNNEIYYVLKNVY
jgi:hypothetical protein